MQNDIYPRFVKSSQYTEMVQRASDASSQGRRWGQKERVLEIVLAVNV